MHKNAEKTNSSRRVHLEILRIIAAFFVIFNHTGAQGFFLFSQRPLGSGSFWVYLIFSVFCKVSVPLFFAISGALLLNRENESLSVIWTKRIPKAVIGLLSVAVLHHGWEIFHYSGSLDVGDLLKSVYSGFFYGTTPGYGHVWYLYAYIAYLMCLPFLRSLAKNLDNRYYFYWIVLALLFGGIIPACEAIMTGGAVSLYGQIRPAWLMESVVFYPCIGYFLEHRLNEAKQKKILPWLWLANAAGILMSCVLVFMQGKATGILGENESQSYHELFVMLNCMAVYLTAKQIMNRIRLPQWLEKGICSLGSCTFGIYLIHMLVLRSGFVEFVLAFLTSLGLNNMLACLLQCSLVMGICYGITFVLKKLPYVKYLVGG